MIDIIFGFDVEDPINPEADDALLELARLFTDEDLQASFFIVGEKARMLRERGRRDAIEALSGHEICYHGNYWADFPEPAMVYGTRLSWDDAVSFALSVELPGLHDVANVTGKFPVAWCCHQAQQCPQLSYALRLAGVRCWAGGPRGYIMDWRSFPRSGRAISSQGSWNAEANPFDRAALKPPLDPDADFAAFQRDFDRMAERVDFITPVGHPTCWAMGDWWGWYDFPSLFANDGTPGPYPRGRRFTPSQPRSHADRAAQLELTRKMVRWLKKRSDCRITTYAELCDEEEEPKPIWITHKKLLSLADRMLKRLTYVVDYGTSFSPADCLYLLCHAISHLWEYGQWPAEQEVKRVIGPVEHVYCVSHSAHIPRSSVIAGAISAYRYILDHGRLPHAIRAHRVDLGPADLLRAAANLVLAEKGTGKLLDNITVEPSEPLPEAAEEPVITDRRFGSSCLPPNFDDSRLWELLRLQSWSYRPAVKQVSHG